MNHLYDRIGEVYNDYRRPDPRLGAAIIRALGDAETVLNVGAGTGSYEPGDRFVVAVEPSSAMVRQRRQGAAPAVQASAPELPFRNDRFTASLAILTVHHWPDRTRGLTELVRVSSRRVVILTWDPAFSGFWLVQDYFPGIMDMDRRIFPPMEELRSALGPIEVRPFFVPHDCADGFLGAYWRRPWSYLDPGIRSAISSFARMENAAEGLEHLRSDLEDGAWARGRGHLLHKQEIDLGYRLVIAEKGRKPATPREIHPP